MASARRARRACGLILALALGGCATTASPNPEPDVAARQGDRDCSDFADQDAAQAWFDTHPGDPDHLDGDGNGVVCESMGAPAKAAGSGPRRARVIAVVDGDTIKVRLDSGARETVRLVGIDTPESKRPQTPVECGSKRAASALRALILGRTVTLRRDRTQDAVDRYGRALAYVEVGRRDAGEAMVGSGWAKAYVYGGVPFERARAYRAAESGARSRAAGVHGACSGDFHRAA